MLMTRIGVNLIKYENIMQQEEPEICVLNYEY